MVSEYTSPSTMWFGNKPSGYGEHVTLEAENGGEWLHVTPEIEGVVIGARGMTMRHSYHLLDKNRIHIEMREILRLCRYETA